jgi:2-polyprenyl-6-methoxyphenol hydroxylase-like FAD-dependent oxidoreductase
MVNKHTTETVAIAGAGLGGLCLAHGLRKAGIDVSVYERDPAPLVRRQGYRITVDEHGTRALRDCLPPHLFDLAAAVAKGAGGYFRYTDRNLRDAFKLTFPDNAEMLGQVDRQTLRTILLMGLEDRVHYAKAVTRIATGTHGAVLQFEDGSRAVEASVVVAADGAGSRLAAQLLPDRPAVDLGASALWGSAPLTVGGRSLLPRAFDRSGVLAVGDSPGRAVFFTEMRFPERPDEVFARLAPDYKAPVNDDYIMWGLVYTPASAPEVGADLSPAQLHAVAEHLSGEFHPIIRHMIVTTAPESVMRTHLRASQRPGTWPQGHVTLLGDAVHSMPPFGAHGGNTALRDAALLAGELQGAFDGSAALTDALAAYRAEMSEYAFEAVDAATKGTQRLIHSSPFQRWMMLRLMPRLHRPTVLARCSRRTRRCCEFRSGRVVKPPSACWPIPTGTPAPSSCRRVRVRNGRRPPGRVGHCRSIF